MTLDLDARWVHEMGKRSILHEFTGIRGVSGPTSRQDVVGTYLGNSDEMEDNNNMRREYGGRRPAHNGVGDNVGSNHDNVR